MCKAQNDEWVHPVKLKTVLVIDDSDADLLYAEIILGKAGIANKAITLGLAQEALDYLQCPEGHDVDVILLDINMPEMNGFEFLEAYQSLHVKHQARAIVMMLTSSPDPRDRARALAFSCVKGYITKPIDLVSARGLVDLVASLDPPAN